MKDLVLYHAKCSDGLFAAYAWYLAVEWFMMGMPPVNSF